MNKIAVVYWSGTGHTEAMAAAVADGADAVLFTAAEFDPASCSEYDAIAFGCPSMGAEQLEESEFQPMWDAVKPTLSGMRIALFGSWGWGSGEWMTAWAQDARQAGAVLAAEPITCQDAPDDDVLADCRSLGQSLR